MRPLDALLALGATIRLTRFITLDDLGHWSIKGPAERWALQHSREETWDPDNPDTYPARLKAVHGLSCPHCISVWLGISLLTTATLATTHPTTRTAYRIITGGLTLSTIAAHTHNHLNKQST